MTKSYFTILGVSSGASAEEVRAAYHRLAKEFHPDHFEGGSGPFREIQEAYSVLGNTQKRDRYERSLNSTRANRSRRHPTGQEPEPLIPEQRPVDFGEISPVRSFRTYTPSYDEVFDWLWHDFSNMAWPKSGRVSEGITCFIKGENYQISFATPKLMVRTDQVEIAKELIKDLKLSCWVTAFDKESNNE